MPLGKRTDFQDAKYAGAEIDFVANIRDALPPLLDCGWDFGVFPLVDPEYRREPHGERHAGDLPASFRAGQVAFFKSSHLSNQVVGKTSRWIEADSQDPAVRRNSELELRQELEWALHLSMQACIIPLPLSRHNANLARVLHQVICGLGSMMLWVQLPFTASQQDGSDGIEDGGADTGIPAASPKADGLVPGIDPWDCWNQVRCLCAYSAKLGVVLEVPESLPDALYVQRWVGEPVRALLLPTTLFMTNKRGFPTLSKAHQQFLLDFFNLGVQIILSGEPLIENPEAPRCPVEDGQVVLSPGGVVSPAELHPLRVYWEYLSYLFRKPPPLDEGQQLEVSYRDYLQAPLQPLQDNLESQTYETFEKDGTKYLAYEEAIAQALGDRMRAPREPSSQDGPPGSPPPPSPTVLMVVGAGRGPLVRAALRAAHRTACPIRVYAVEKNPNAVIMLQHLIAAEGWEDVVTVVGADMRHWEAPEKADILVSELLGSFGDNELSPECLDGAQRFLQPGGISIPTSYTSFLQPITSSKLWSDVKAYDDLEHFETPYVVKLHRVTPLGRAQPVFTFSHPNWEPNIDNSRSADLRFPRDDQLAAMCHGLAGYFEAHLYGDVGLSTNPSSHTPDMFSWFPIYFPLQTPMYCPAGAPIAVQMWRCLSPHKVWYEWSITSPQVCPIHNVNGRSSYVGM
eukprot:jgi/Botrbrau1/3393/Bobra.0337s0034.1